MATRITRSTTTPRVPPIPCAMYSAAAPTIAAAGRVKIHAVAMRPATPQRTWAPFFPRPVPMIDPVATCVVDSEKPKLADSRMTAADADSAAMPCGDSISTRPLPSVRMTRQPPE